MITRREVWIFSKARVEDPEKGREGVFSFLLSLTVRELGGGSVRSYKVEKKNTAWKLHQKLPTGSPIGRHSMKVFESEVQHLFEVSFLI